MTVCPKWGAIVSLLDKDGNEVYNSGFQTNSLTPHGIWSIVGIFSEASIVVDNLYGRCTSGHNLLFHSSTNITNMYATGYGLGVGMVGVTLSLLIELRTIQ